MKHTRQLFHAFLLATLLAAPGATAAAKPIQVFILAGQSNMEGPASITTFDYYRLLIEHVKKVLADPQRVYPDYDAAQGFELAGFVWLQGFNDMVDGHVYPNHNTPNRFDLYAELLAHFIRDVRQDLTAPSLPFVIGVMGVGGLKDESVDMVAFRRAMSTTGFKTILR
jgi:hypothetical protein